MVDLPGKKLLQLELQNSLIYLGTVIRAQFYKNLILKRDFLLMLLYPNTLYSWDLRF